MDIFTRDLFLKEIPTNETISVTYEKLISFLSDEAFNLFMEIDFTDRDNDITLMCSKITKDLLGKFSKISNEKISGFKYNFTDFNNKCKAYNDIINEYKEKSIKLNVKEKETKLESINRITEKCKLLNYILDKIFDIVIFSSKKTFYFTFGLGTKNSRKYQPIVADNMEMARRKMFEVYGSNWSFGYNEEDFKDSYDKKNGTALEVIYCEI